MCLWLTKHWRKKYYDLNDLIYMKYSPITLVIMTWYGKVIFYTKYIYIHYIHIY